MPVRKHDIVYHLVFYNTDEGVVDFVSHTDYTEALYSYVHGKNDLYLIKSNLITGIVTTLEFNRPNLDKYIGQVDSKELKQLNNFLYTYLF